MRAILILSVAVASTGCVGSLKNPERFRDGSPADGSASACRLSIDVETAIFQPRCATVGCHTGATPSNGLDLTPPNVWSRLAGRTSSRCMSRPWANPAAPADSLMVQVLGTASPCSIVRMPLAAAPLTADEIDCVSAWIASQSGGGDGGTDGGGIDGGGTDTGGTDTGGTDTGGTDTSRPDTPPPPRDVMMPADVPAMMVFLENGGTVVMEAENADENMMRAGISWTRSTANAGFSGTAAMLASPNMMVNNNVGYMTMSPQLRFRVDFRTAGTYFVWGRGWGASTDDDSFHAGVDNTAPMGASRIGPYWTMGVPPAWVWNNNTLDTTRAQITIAAAGVHTVEIWMREDGFELDKLLLTTDMAMTPMGNGPAQSMRGAPR